MFRARVYLTFICALYVLTQVAESADWPFQTSTVRTVAKKIDRLQRKIDDVGIVAAKTPDIWGESRLLQHREEFEKQMELELTQFRSTLQAAESTRDVAFLASALSISRGINPGSTDAGQQGTSQSVIVDAKDLIPSSTELSAVGNGIVPRTSSYGPKFSGKLNGGFMDESGKAIEGISLEPVLFLDQQKRYLDYLHALRRLNEGDDTVDSPGYSLNLVRIPVSILPGQHTRIGYGAELQVSVDPYANEELLPESFRNFVTNGVADRLAAQVTRILSRITGKQFETLEDDWKLYRLSIMIGQYALNPDAPNPPPDHVRIKMLEEFYVAIEGRLNAVGGDTENFKEELTALLKMLREVIMTDDLGADLLRLKNKDEKLDGTAQRLRSAVNGVIQLGESRKESAGDAIASFEFQARQPLEEFTSGTATFMKRAFPVSMDPAVNGTSLVPIIITARQALARSGQTIHYEDVRRFLVQEIAAAYSMLNQVEAGSIWQQNCSPALVRAVRSNKRGIGSVAEKAWAYQDLPANSSLREETLSAKRREYYQSVRMVFPEADFTTMSHLGWHIIVESALLNDRLLEDIRVVSAQRNCPCVAGYGVDFFGPTPSMEAREAFRQYVRCRWPVKVFTLDPMTNDQNVASAFSQRREMQIALAVGFAQGRISAQKLDRFVRRMEYDLETIDLNRTTVGFAAGRDTFGWRFYPRVQAPPVPGNVTAAFRDLFVGGRSRDDLLQNRMLEPGIRECVALIVMPSFVPSLSVDVQSSWFKLAHSLTGKPMKRKMDLEDAVDLAATAVDIRREMNKCMEDRGNVRSAEIRGLCRSLDRLERQLPLQSSLIQVPFENQLSGFELFNSGLAGLGPQLIDWYGGPGIYVSKTESNTKETATDQSGKPTTIFLVGRNFSSLGASTRVIAGGIDVTDSKHSVSRSVLSVTIPSNVLTSKGPDDGAGREVDIQLAPPHGVPRRIEVPVAESATAEEEAEKASTIEKKVTELEKNLASTLQLLPVQPQWATPTKIDGCIVNAGNRVGVKLSSSARVRISEWPFQSDIQIMDIAISAEVSKDGKKYERLTKSDNRSKIDGTAATHFDTIAITIESGERVALFPTGKLQNAVHHLLQQSSYLPKDLKAMRLQGFIRVTDAKAEYFTSGIEGVVDITFSPCEDCKKVIPASSVFMPGGPSLNNPSRVTRLSHNQTR